MKVIALYSIKGGVGKTASAVNLAYMCAQGGNHTLLWDLDPQGAASFNLRIKAKLAGGPKALFGRDIMRYVKQSDYDNLDLLPADFSNRKLDLLFDARTRRKQQVRRLLESVADRYDYVFIDSPPGLTLVVENILRAADLVLSPLIPSTLSLRTLDQLTEFVRHPKLRGLRLWVFFSMVDVRRQLHREVMKQLATQRQGLMRHFIPYSSDIERMGVIRAPVEVFARRSQGGLAYRGLWSEVARRLTDHG
ncbi:MAG: ParA family protein [Gammaproteobacteria bacterium]|nr:ParA family protein [Gammaproteobacteria bacterium]